MRTGRIVRVLADPDTKSIKHAAEQLKVTPQALYKRLDDKLWEEIRQAVRQAVKTEIGPIWQALVRAAKRGDIAAADRVLKRAGEYDDLDLSEQAVKHVVEIRQVKGK